MVAEQDHDDESLRLELQEAILTYRHWVSTFTQIAGFIIAGAVVLLSYGFTQKLAAILLLAVPAPILILLIYLLVGSVIGSLIDLIQRIEKSLRIPEDSLGATYAQAHRRSMPPPPDNVVNLNDEEVRRLTQHLRRKYTFWSRVPIILYAATVGLIGLFVLSLTVFHYRFM